MASKLFASRTSDAIDIEAPADLVWSVYSNVVGWPAWTESVTSVELSPPGPLAVGSRAQIKQPRLPRVEWTVTALETGREWVWENKAPGRRRSPPTRSLPAERAVPMSSCGSISAASSAA